MGLGGLVLDFPSLLYKGLRILMFQLSGVYCKYSGLPVLTLNLKLQNLKTLHLYQNPKP